MLSLAFNLLCDMQDIINDDKVSDGILNFGVAQKELDNPDITGLRIISVGLVRLKEWGQALIDANQLS